MITAIQNDINGINSNYVKLDNRFKIYMRSKMIMPNSDERKRDRENN